MQVGRRARTGWKLTIAAVGDTWYRGEHEVSWGAAGALLRLEPLGGGAERRVRSVASNLFLEDLTLRPSDAAALGLGRFTAPAPALLYGEHPCEKVLLQLRIPEIGVDQPVVAFVLPEDQVR